MKINHLQTLSTRAVGAFSLLHQEFKSDFDHHFLGAYYQRTSSARLVEPFSSQYKFNYNLERLNVNLNYKQAIQDSILKNNDGH